MTVQHQIKILIDAILEHKTQNLQKYTDASFCIDLKLYCLNKIKYMIVNMMNTHLHHEFVGSQEPFYISHEINNLEEEDHLSILDYCIIAGLPELAQNFAKLGCKNKINIQEFQTKLKQQFPNQHTPDIVADINAAIHRIDIGIEEYKAMPLPAQKPDNAKASYYERIVYFLKNFPYQEHKFAIFFLAFGVSCLIAAPFNGGASAILLCSLGIPTLIAAVSSLQISIAAMKDYQQAEEKDRVTHEAYFLRTLRTDVSENLEMELKAHLQLHKLAGKKKTNDVHVHAHYLEKSADNKLLFKRDQIKPVQRSKSKSWLSLLRKTKLD